MLPRRTIGVSENLEGISKNPRPFEKESHPSLPAKIWEGTSRNPRPFELEGFAFNKIRGEVK